MLTKSFQLQVFDRNGNNIGAKTISDNRDYLNDWFNRPKGTIPAIPLKSALSVGDGKVSCDKVPEHTIGYSALHGNDPQQNQLVCFLSSAFANGHGCVITPDTFTKVMVQVAVRKLIKPTWLNDRDQFQVPICDRETYKTDSINETKLPKEFIADCVVFDLFHGCNNTSAWEPVYNGSKVKIDNQFYPYSTNDTLEWVSNDLQLSQKVKKANDTFVANWLNDNHANLSKEAIEVLDLGKEVYEEYFKQLPNLMQKKYHLDFWNVGWYQIRMAMKEGSVGIEQMEKFKVAYTKLTQKLTPKVYEFGFIEK